MNREGYVQLGEVAAGYTAAVASAIQKENPPTLPGEDSNVVQAPASMAQTVSSKMKLEEAEKHVQGLMRSSFHFIGAYHYRSCLAYFQCFD
jgi:hypothetical protein